MPITVDSLEIEVKEKANSASQNIDKLINSMKKLRAETQDTVNALKLLSNVLNNISQTTNSVKTNFESISKSAGKTAKSIKNAFSQGKAEIQSFTAAYRKAKDDMAGDDNFLPPAVSNAMFPSTNTNGFSSWYEPFENGAKQLVDDIGAIDAEWRYVDDAVNSAAESANGILMIEDKHANSAGKTSAIYSTLKSLSDGISKAWGKSKGYLDAFFTKAKQTAKETGVLNGKFKELFASLKRIAMYRLIRTAFSSLTKVVKEGMQNAYQFSKIWNGEFADTMDNLASSALMTKNQIGSAFSELVIMIKPLLDSLMQKVYEWSNALSNALAYANGDTQYKRAKYMETAWDDATDAANKYKNMVLGIDELNILSESKKQSNTELDYSQMFEYTSTKATKFGDAIKWVLDNLDAVKTALVSIAVTAAALTLPTKFLSGIGYLAENVQSIKKGLGVTLSIASIGFEITSAIDIGKNGATLENVIKTALGGVGLIAGGLIGFGAASLAITIPLAITLPVIGIAIGEYQRGKQNFLNSESYKKILEIKDEIENNLAISGKIKLEYDTRQTNFDSIISDVQSLKAEIDRVVYLSDEKGKGTLASSELKELNTLITDLNGKGVSIDIDADGKIKTTKNDMYEILQTMLQTKLLEHAGDAYVNSLLDYQKQKLQTDEARKAYVELYAMLDEAQKNFEDASGYKYTTLENYAYWREQVKELQKQVEEASAAYDSQKQLLGALEKETNTYFEILENSSDTFNDLYEKLGLTTQGFKESTEEVNKYAEALSRISTIPGIRGNKFEMTQIDAFASGGFPETGQLFLANEAGAEMVGAMGNRTAVANSDQIVAGIQSGVSSAVSAVLAPYLAQIANNTRETANKDFSVNIGDRDIARANARGSRALGRTIISTT